MNRELKFRVFNGASMEYNVTVGKFGNFYVNPEKGDGLNPRDTASLTTCTTKYHEDTPVMQFTGLLDKNGKEIYEGDIIKLGFDEKGEHLRVIEWKRYGFFVKQINGEANFPLTFVNPDEGNDWEVVSNIFENQK